MADGQEDQESTPEDGADTGEADARGEEREAKESAPEPALASRVTLNRMIAHDLLAHQSRIVLRLGQMLLACGASGYRVTESMARLARCVGIEEHHAQVTYTEIIATAYAHGTFRTELTEQRAMGVNADMLDRLTSFVSGLDGRVSVAQVDERLDQIEAKPPLYGTFLNALASGVACAGFCFLNHGGLIECSAVAIAAFFGQMLRKQMMRRRMNHFGVWMACAALASLIYVGLVSLGEATLHVAPTHEAGYISSVLFLVPGFPLVTAIIDLVRQDFQVGISRATYVFMLMMSTGISVWVVSLALHWSVTPEWDYHLPTLILIGARLIATFVASYGFAMLFNSPPLVCLCAAVIAALINTGRFELLSLDVPAQVAAGLAALVAGLLATGVASRTRFSRVTLSVPAVVIMIPGVPMYRLTTYLSDGQVQNSVAQLFIVAFTIVAIGVGLALSRMVTDRNWLVNLPRQVPNLGAYPPSSAA